MRWISLSLVVLSIGAAFPARAAVIEVAAGGSVQAALDKTQAGDVVRLAAGVYRERVVFKSSGTHGKPVVLEGAPGAILEGSDDVKLDWQAAPTPGATPDAGALQFGEALPQWPRTPQTVNAPPAGSWPGAEAEKARFALLVPVLQNGDFAAGLTGWGKEGAKIDAASFQVKTEGALNYLSATATTRAELATKITSLAPGQSYVLSFQARANTCADARVILRNLKNAGYLGMTAPSKDAGWKTQSIKFTAPGPEVGLEISLRAPGSVELSGFAVEKVK